MGVKRVRKWITEKILQNIMKQKVYMADNPDLIIEMATKLKIFKLLRDNGYLITHGKDKNMPKQKYLDQGLFKITERTSDKSNRENISTTTLITGKGQLYFSERIKNRG